jgi:beta-glucosidase
MSAALQCCEGSDAIILCVGEAAAMSGEAASRAHLGLPGVQRAFCELVFARARQLQDPRDRGAVFGPAAGDSMAHRSRGCRAGRLVSGQRGRQCHRRFDQRAPKPQRPHRRELAARGRSGADFLRRKTERPAGRSRRSLHQQVPGRRERSAFPFGFGLTYGKFELSNLRVTPQLGVAVAVHRGAHRRRECGDREAEETLFLFTHDVLASVARPLLELKAFGKIRWPRGPAAPSRCRLPRPSCAFSV